MKIRELKTRIGILAATAALAAAPVAQAGAVAYSRDLTGFLGATAGVQTIDFDLIAPGTDITGQTIQGVEFQAPGAPLEVVDASTTVTTGGFVNTTNTSLNRLFATTGANVLSPGGTQLVVGPNPAVEDDSLTLVFHRPVVAFGIDLLWQQADGASFTDIRVYDTANNLLYSKMAESTPVWNGAGWEGGSDFFGIVATNGTLLGRVEFIESDNDHRYADSNIGYDTIRFQASEVPEPATLVFTGAGLLALGIARRRKVSQ
ncbi:MAG: PEP-CTERM sorting domain-containing protein [Bryobacteraceae bacterium]